MFIITGIFSCVNRCWKSKWALRIIETSIFCSVHASSTDKANVKVIKCKDAQTVTKDDKSSLKEAGFTKCAEPFGILVAGKTKTTDKTVLAMAKVVAELLDQNRDGKIYDNLYTIMTMKYTFVYIRVIPDGN